VRSLALDYLLAGFGNKRAQARLSLVMYRRALETGPAAPAPREPLREERAPGKSNDSGDLRPSDGSQKGGS